MKRTGQVLRALLVIALLGWAGLSLSACSKRCDSAAGCQRSCPCTDSESGLTYPCNMTFLCDSEAKVCDSMHGASCDDICQKYAAAGLCGKQCTKDAECLQRCACGDAGTILCEQAFSCDTDLGVCEAAHARTSCAQICESCAVNP